MTTDEIVTKAWLALQAEQWALNLRKRINIYTDSRYAFAILHDNGAIYKDRGLLTAGGKEIKNKEEILQLLETVWKPFKMAVIHCKGHQREIERQSGSLSKWQSSIAKAIKEKSIQSAEGISLPTRQ